MTTDWEGAPRLGRPEAQCFTLHSYSGSSTESSDDSPAGADAGDEQPNQARASTASCWTACPAPSVCVDEDSERAARWQLAIARHQACRADALVLARLDQHFESSPIRLGAGGTAAHHAEAILLHCAAISENLRREHAQKASAHVEEAKLALQVAKQAATKAVEELNATAKGNEMARRAEERVTRRGDRRAAVAEEAREAKAKVDEAEKTLVAAAHRYGDHPEIIELINIAAAMLRSFEEVKPHLPDIAVSRERSAAAKRARKALDGIRFYSDADQSTPTERVALLMMAIRNAAEAIPRGRRVAPIPEPPRSLSELAYASWEKLPAEQRRPLTQGDCAVWSGFSAEERQRLVDAGLNCCWRWYEPGRADVERALDAATEDVIRRVPDLDRWFRRAADAPSLASNRAEYRRAIREAVSLFTRPRKPNPGSTAQKRLDAEQALRRAWGLPPVNTVTRRDEAKALLPLLGLIDAVPRCPDDEELQLAAVAKSIARGTAIREGEHKLIRFEKAPARARKTKTGAVLVSPDVGIMLAADGTTSTARASTTTHSKPRARGDRERRRR